MPSLLDLSATQPHASRSSQRNGLISMCYIATSYQLFTRGSIYTSMPLSQFVPPSSSPSCVNKSVLCVYSSIPALQIWFICTIFLDFPYIFIYIHTLMCINICFSLSDLTHFVWQTLGSSTSLQMVQFHSFLWPSNIPLYRWPHFLDPFICQWTLGLLPCPGFCK